MDSYCQYNDAFYNSDNENLDRLARQVNNDKKKLHKKIQENIDRQEQNACLGIDCLLDPSNARYGPSNLSDFGFFSTQGDFSSNLPTPMTKNKKKRSKKQDNFQSDSASTFSADSSFTNNTTNSAFTNNTTNSAFTNNTAFTNNMAFAEGSEDIPFDSDVSSNYSSLPPKIKKHLRLNTNHLKSYKESDEKNILGHIKYCNQCKHQLINLLKSDNHAFNESSNTETIDKTINSGILNLNSPELKDMLILILIGIFIIVIADIFFRR